MGLMGTPATRTGVPDGQFAIGEQLTRDANSVDDLDRTRELPLTCARASTPALDLTQHARRARGTAMRGRRASTIRLSQRLRAMTTSLSDGDTMSPPNFRRLTLPACIAVVGLIATGCAGAAGSGSPATTAPPTPVQPPKTWRPEPAPPDETPLATAPVPGQQKALVEPVVHLSSPWFQGTRFVGINYGCNPTPYYPPSSRCRNGQGFHHGIDISMPEGDPIYSNVSGFITSGSPGSAYGEKAFLIRTKKYDIVIGHASRTFVKAGDRVEPGQLLAYAGDSGTPDGYHLHFEVRPVGRGYTSAVDPMDVLEGQVVASEPTAAPGYR